MEHALREITAPGRPGLTAWRARVSANRRYEKPPLRVVRGRERALIRQLEEARAVVPDALRARLMEEQRELETIPGRLAVETEAESKKAGTFAETPEFRLGLESEVGARVRGATLEAKRRIDALKRRLGIPVE